MRLTDSRGPASDPRACGVRAVPVRSLRLPRGEGIPPGHTGADRSPDPAGAAATGVSARGAVTTAAGVPLGQTRASRVCGVGFARAPRGRDVLTGASATRKLDSFVRILAGQDV